MRVRVVREGDLGAVGLAYWRAWVGTTAESTLEEAVADVRAAWDGAYGSWLADASLLAEEDDGAVLGAILLVTDPPWPDAPRGPWVLDLFVDPDRRREGIGRALVLSALDAAGSRSVALRVDDDAPAALALYLALGFRPPHGPPVPGGSVPLGGTARRPTWTELPPELRHAIEDRAGSAVTTATSQGGGYTGGFASRLVLADGRRLFVKAADGDEAAWMADSYRHEAAVVRALPEAVPAPRVLWEVEAGGWVAVGFEDLEARLPARPWQGAELDAVLETVTATARALTPPPQVGLVEMADQAQHFRTWQRAAAGEAEVLACVPPAWRARVERLAELEAAMPHLAAGDTACHFDLRDDNLLLTADGRVVVCDWNWLTRGAAWVDLVGLLVSVHGDGLDAEAVLATHPLSRDADPRAVDALLAALAGHFVASTMTEQPPGSPWLRLHQAWWRDATLDWLDRRWSAR